jgi:hypothetical protein
MMHVSMAGGTPRSASAEWHDPETIYQSRGNAQIKGRIGLNCDLHVEALVYE